MSVLFSCQSCLTLCDPMDYNTPGLPVPHHLLKFAQVHVHCISDAIQQSYPLMPSSDANFSSIRDFSNELAFHIGWPNYWSFSFSISPSNEYSRLISLKINWFDIFAIQGVWSPCWFDLPADSQESSLAPQASKAWILWCSAFFTVQLSQPNVTTGKTTTE